MRWTSIKDFKSVAYGHNMTAWEIFDKWAKGKGITHFASRYSDYTKIFPKINFATSMTMDHVYFFRNKDLDQVWLTSQPYQDIKMIEDEIKEYCKHDNLHFEYFDSSHSWYYPGRTCLVVITK